MTANGTAKTLEKKGTVYVKDLYMCVVVQLLKD